MALRVLVVVIALLTGVGRAAAEDKPWAAGVSEAHQAEALVIYREGNTFFEQAQYVDALARYERAIVIWDHPAIRYNAAVCLINLDKPVEAYEYLTAAMRFGAAPLGPELHKQGLSYQRLLAPRIAELEIVVNEPGAKVSLDGAHLFEGPGKMTRHVLAANPHQLVAAKDKYQTETLSVTVPPGETRTLVLEMKLQTAPGKLARRWRTWKPWAVVIGGGVVGLAGLGMYAKAKGGFDDYDAGVNDQCPCATLPASLASTKRGAERDQVIAFSAFAIGGAAIATGALLIYLNQPRFERAAPTIVPVVGPGQAGAVISARW